MNKIFESERLQFEVEENTKAIIEKVEALENELQEAKTTLVGIDAELKSYVVTDDAKIQDAYYHGQYDYIATVKPKVQQNLRVYFTKGWIAVLDNLEVEATSPLMLEHNVLIPKELVIIPNPKIQAIINDESLIREIERTGPIAISGGEITSSTVVSSTDKPPQF